MVVRFLAASSCRRILFSLNHLMLRFIRRVRREMNLGFRVLSVFFVLFSVVLEEQVEEISVIGFVMVSVLLLRFLCVVCAMDVCFWCGIGVVGMLGGVFEG